MRSREASIRVLLATISLCIAPAATADLEFEGPIALPPASCTQNVVAARLDGDAHVDFATTSCPTSATELLVHFGDGNGGIRDILTIPTAYDPAHVVAYDFDADGLVDLAAWHGSYFAFHRNDGAGGFEPEVPTSLPLFTNAVDFADANGDGFEDLAAIHGGSASVLLGAGDGTFGAPILLASFGLRSPRGVGWGDVDEDGAQDVVILVDKEAVGETSHIVIATGSGDGEFTVSQEFPFHERADIPRSLLVADADGDGHVDLLVSSFGRGAFVSYGDGLGNFFPARNYDTLGKAEEIVLGDFDGDRVLDLGVANSQPLRFSILLGSGEGLFGPATTFATPGYLQDIDAPDIDEDGHSDILVATHEQGIHYYLDRAPERCRAGTVNLGAGALTDVVFANGSPGGVGRRVVVASDTPLTISVAAPPLAVGPSRYALGLWLGEPSYDVSYPLPFGAGELCRPLAFHGAAPLPTVLFNNTGRNRLGAPTFPSSPAPADVIHRPSGVGRTVTFFVQGVILDPGSAGSKPASATNGVLIDVR